MWLIDRTVLNEYALLQYLCINPEITFYRLSICFVFISPLEQRLNWLKFCVLPLGSLHTLSNRISHGRCRCDVKAQVVHSDQILTAIFPKICSTELLRARPWYKVTSISCVLKIPSVVYHCHNSAACSISGHVIARWRKLSGNQWEKHELTSTGNPVWWKQFLDMKMLSEWNMITISSSLMVGWLATAKPSVATWHPYTRFISAY